MAQAVAESLLDGARKASVNEKIALRKSLKADLSKRMNALSITQRRKLRSRHEAAVS
jgi:hypothetical protein